mgnify:FL=1
MTELEELELLRHEILPEVAQDRETQKKIATARQLLKAEEHLAGTPEATKIREQRKALMEEIGISEEKCGKGRECAYKHILSAEGELIEAKTAKTGATNSNNAIWGYIIGGAIVGAIAGLIWYWVVKNTK